MSAQSDLLVGEKSLTVARTRLNHSPNMAEGLL